MVKMFKNISSNRVLPTAALLYSNGGHFVVNTGDTFWRHVTVTRTQSSSCYGDSDMTSLAVPDRPSFSHSSDVVSSAMTGLELIAKGHV